ncbi:unnamed protein product [Rangifer tarandus platyrhynchus]|uniref:Uncharacterized protein n=2 Tax=Rangifer tarandus platyrhynchus TaxID=3082113 RepID=A0AC59YBN8_RANTA|nr:unnamed protein product [Rangifer tarandus platyrhynchus]
MKKAPPPASQGRQKKSSRGPSVDSELSPVDIRGGFLEEVIPTQGIRAGVEAASSLSSPLPPHCEAWEVRQAIGLPRTGSATPVCVKGAAAKPVCPEGLCGPALPCAHPAFVELMLEMRTSGLEVDKTQQGWRV